MSLDRLDKFGLEISKEKPVVSLMLPNPAAATKELTSPPKPVASPNALVTPISDDIEPTKKQ